MRARRQDTRRLSAERAARRPNRCRCCDLSAFEPLLKGTGEGREISTTMAFVRILQHPRCSDKDARQAHRADRARRVAHVRHGRAVPPDRHLESGRPEVHSGRLRPADVLPASRQTGQILQEGINEAGGMSRLDRSGDVVLDARRDHDPVLHLLFDVRLPAHRRPRVGRGRHALARLPAGRHGRPHDAERRRPATRGRPLAAVGRVDAELHQLRPDVRVTNSRSSCRTACAAWSRSRKTCTTTSR